MIKRVLGPLIMQKNWFTLTFAQSKCEMFSFWLAFHRSYKNMCKWTNEMKKMKTTMTTTTATVQLMKSERNCALMLIWWVCHCFRITYLGISLFICFGWCELGLNTSMPHSSVTLSSNCRFLLHYFFLRFWYFLEQKRKTETKKHQKLACKQVKSSKSMNKSHI